MQKVHKRIHEISHGFPLGLFLVKCLSNGFFAISPPTCYQLALLCLLYLSTNKDPNANKLSWAINYPLVGELLGYFDKSSISRRSLFLLPIVEQNPTFLRPALFQSFVSSTSRLSVFIRPSIVDVVVDIPVVEVAVETISVAMETWRYDYLHI